MSTALQPMDNGGGLYPGLSMPDLFKFCQAIASSGLVAAQSAEQVMVIVLAGREFGLSPMAALLNCHMIKGKLSMSADMMAALAGKKGISIHLRVSTNDRAVYQFSQGDYQPPPFEYNLDDAKRANLFPGKPGSNWQANTKAMLRARALSNGLRGCFPGLMSGAYLKDEMEEAPPMRTIPAPAVVTEATQAPSHGHAALGGGPTPAPRQLADQSEVEEPPFEQPRQHEPAPVQAEVVEQPPQGGGDSGGDWGDDW